MPFEINAGRTPPTMMFTMSPSTPGLEFERNSPHGHNRPLAKSTDQFKDVSNLKVNQRRSRSFTPVKDSLYLRSPEISPIDASNNRNATLEQVTQVDYNVLKQTLTPLAFKVPLPLNKTNEVTTPTGPNEVTTPTGPNEHHSRHRQATPVEDLNQTQILDKSASHGYLNHKLEVRLILKNAGMQQYIEAFDKEKVDFGKFLSLCEEDLLGLGVERKVDRKVIFKIISDLNEN